MEIKVSVDTSLAAAIRQLPAVLDTHIKAGLMAAGTMLAGEMKRNVLGNDSMDNSNLVNSFGVFDTGALSVQVRSGVVHGTYVDQGVGPGGAPPKKVIEAWLRKRGMDESLSFPIARSIYRRGIRPKPFVQPAIESKQVAVQARVDRAVRNAIAAAGLV